MSAISKKRLIELCANPACNEVKALGLSCNTQKPSTPTFFVVLQFFKNLVEAVNLLFVVLVEVVDVGSVLKVDDTALLIGNDTLDLIGQLSSQERDHSENISQTKTLKIYSAVETKTLIDAAICEKCFCCIVQ